jgi:CDP-4-dehydro-6-deoxyglucose reductase
MFEISLKNNKKFLCDEELTIFQAAKNSNILLNHSCLAARCKSCIVKVIEGNTVNIHEESVLSKADKEANYVLSCNAKPTSNLVLDIEDLGDIKFYEKRIIPSKIDSIEYLTEDVIKLSLRFPPTANFKFISGQYVNLIKGGLKRSYSIANQTGENSKVTFYIKKYENGLMSKYWFKEAKPNDLIRLEGPLGAFFYRKSEQTDIIFLATGTGVAPVKSILEEIVNSNVDFSNKNFTIIVGARKKENLFWKPEINKNINLKFIPVLSRPGENWEGARGYVQDVLLKQNIELSKAQVYACGSNEMIESSRKLLIQNSLPENQFYSDAFVCTN